MSRASEHFDEWLEMLSLLDMKNLSKPEQVRLYELKLFFRGGKVKSNEKRRIAKSKPLVLIDPNGKRTIYDSRKELIQLAGVNPDALYDALLRGNGRLTPKKWKGYTVKEMT